MSPLYTPPPRRRGLLPLLLAGVAGGLVLIPLALWLLQVAVALWAEGPR